MVVENFDNITNLRKTAKSVDIHRKILTFYKSTFYSTPYKYSILNILLKKSWSIIKRGGSMQEQVRLNYANDIFKMFCLQLLAQWQAEIPDFQLPGPSAWPQSPSRPHPIMQTWHLQLQIKNTTSVHIQNKSTSWCI